MMKSYWFLFATSLLLVAPALAQGDATKGKQLYVICATCHGENGEGLQALNGPRLAGQHSWYLERQLQYYKSGIRGTNPKDIYGLQMAPMSATLPDDQAIKDVVAYIGTLNASAPAASSGGDAAKGKQLYAICATCHGQNGEGLQALNGPRLAGQFGWYLERQLKNFKEGIRGTNPKDIYGLQMAPMSATLPDDQAIKDVVAYIESLK